MKGKSGKFFLTLVVSISFFISEMTLGRKKVSGRVWPGMRMTPGFAISTISCTRSSSSMWRPDTSRESPRYCNNDKVVGFVGVRFYISAG